MWFSELTGFEETNGDEVRGQLTQNGEFLVSAANGRIVRCGRLTAPTRESLRTSMPEVNAPSTLREQVGNVTDLHRDLANEGAMFQVASQFNLLETGSPDVIPEAGLSGYDERRTQGPACAVACGAGTIYRNYFATVAGGMGQSADRQIDCLSDLANELDNTDNRLWEMRNGFCLATADGLAEIADRVADEAERDRLMGLLRIGVHQFTEVTISEEHHPVSQAYCSALPIAYCDHPVESWEPFARLVLDGAYEATLAAAAANAQSDEATNRVYLTLLGGGVFGNPTGWILDSIERAMEIHCGSGLDVEIVSYGYSDPAVVDLTERYSTS